MRTYIRFIITYFGLIIKNKFDLDVLIFMSCELRRVSIALDCTIV